MDMDNFFGLTFLPKTQKRTIMSSIIKEIGGADYQMVKEFIKKLMVLNLIILGDMYTGSFKNGLKHG